MFATAFHLFQDGLVGGGDVELGIVHDPVRGRRVRGWVGNFEVTLEVDAGSIVGDVEGKPYAMTVTGGYVSSPDFQVDYRHATYVAGDMDVDGQDFDFDVDRAPGFMRGWGHRLRRRGRAPRRGGRGRHRPLPLLPRRLLDLTPGPRPVPRPRASAPRGGAGPSVVPFPGWEGGPRREARAGGAGENGPAGV